MTNFAFIWLYLKIGEFLFTFKESIMANKSVTKIFAATQQDHRPHRLPEQGAFLLSSCAC